MWNSHPLIMGLKLVSLITLVLCLLCGWLFYEFYFKWMFLFEDGRYFDPATGVVYHDSALIRGYYLLHSC